MSEKNLQDMRVAILTAQDVERAELIEPRKALEQAGAQTMVVSPKPGSVQTVNHDDKADKVPVDCTFDECNPGDFDAVLLPGGALNADSLRVEAKAQEFVREFDRAGKPIAVICHGSWLLVSARLVKGRTLTSYHTIQDDLRNAGANWKDQEVVRDKNWVSSRNPGDIPAFNRAMIELFSEKRASAKGA